MYPMMIIRHMDNAFFYVGGVRSMTASNVLLFWHRIAAAASEEVDLCAWFVAAMDFTHCSFWLLSQCLRVYAICSTW